MLVENEGNPMNVLESLALSREGFSTQAAIDGAAPEGPVLTFHMTGDPSTGHVDAVGVLFGKLHEEAQRAKVKEVVFDLMKLEFMNSSCFKQFVTLIDKVQETEGGAPYRL